MLVVTISVNELNTAESFSSQIVNLDTDFSENSLKMLNTKLRWACVDKLKELEVLKK